jgi:hypothetical protein
MMTLNVNVKVEVEFELDVFRPGCSTEPPEGWAADEADWQADNTKEGWEVEVGGGGEVR